MKEKIIALGLVAMLLTAGTGAVAGTSSTGDLAGVVHYAATGSNQMVYWAGGGAAIGGAVGAIAGPVGIGGGATIGGAIGG